MKYFTSTLGSYIGALPSMGLNLGAFNEKSSSWIENWTIFYWDGGFLGLHSSVHSSLVFLKGAQ